MSPKRKPTTAPDATVERIDNSEREIGLRPELRPEPVGEPWPPVLGLTTEFLSIHEPRRRTIKLELQLRGKRIIVISVLILVPILVYSTVTHDHGIIQRVIHLLQHFK